MSKFEWESWSTIQREFEIGTSQFQNPRIFRSIVKITWTRFCAKDPHKDRKAMYSSSTKVEYATDIMLGRIVRFKKLSSATQRRYKKFCYAGASTACRLVVFSATFGYCLVGILCLSVSLSWKIIPIVK
jgi:hypothetical protein